MAYQAGDLVIYGNYGVCKVEMVGKPDVSGIDKNRLYYTLYALYQDQKIYTPVDTAVFMRPVITHAKAQQLISLIPSIQESVYHDRRINLLEDYYKEILQTHDCYDLLKLIKMIWTKNKLAVEQGKKPGQIDERFMRIAEELLYGEFAVALGIPKDSVKSYIEESVESQKNVDTVSIGGDLYEYCK